MLAAGGYWLKQKMSPSASRGKGELAFAQDSIEVDVPISTAYNQWTQFEEFPKFMKDVEEVRQIDDTHLHWRANIAGKPVEWDAEITTQIPDRRISWRSTSGPPNSGAVTFDPVTDNRTRITLRMSYRALDLLEKGAVRIELSGNLHRFADFIQTRQRETGAWRGTVVGGVSGGNGSGGAQTSATTGTMRHGEHDEHRLDLTHGLRGSPRRRRARRRPLRAADPHKPTPVVAARASTIGAPWSLRRSARRPMSHSRPFTSGLRRRSVLVAAAGSAVVAPFGSAFAQSYPTRPITLIVPWPAGGSTDRHHRLLAELAGKQLGQPIVVDNRPGGGGTTGPGTMALNAKPDGYTIAQFPMGMLRVPHMQKVQWDPLKDFTFILGISGYTFGLTVRADSPYKTFNEYIEAARKAPGKIDYGSTGMGTSPHLLMEDLAANAKVQLVHVPFKGNADLTQAVLGGHVMAQSDASGWDKLVEAGQLRLLVTFGEKRTKRWPNVPTAQELGYGIVSTSPYGLVGPKGMEPAVVKTLHDAFKKAMDEPRHLELLDQLNQDMWYRTGDEYANWARETFAKDKALIERLGLAAK